MINLSETVKISCHYEPFTTAGAIFRETDRTSLYSKYIFYKIIFYKINKIYFLKYRNYTSVCSKFAHFGSTSEMLPTFPSQSLNVRWPKHWIASRRTFQERRSIRNMLRPYFPANYHENIFLPI